MFWIKKFGHITVKHCKTAIRPLNLCWICHLLCHHLRAPKPHAQKTAFGIPRYMGWGPPHYSLVNWTWQNNIIFEISLNNATGQIPIRRWQHQIICHWSCHFAWNFLDHASHPPKFGIVKLGCLADLTIVMTLQARWVSFGAYFRWVSVRRCGERLEASECDLLLFVSWAYCWSALVDWWQVLSKSDRAFTNSTPSNVDAKMQAFCMVDENCDGVWAEKDKSELGQPGMCHKNCQMLWDLHGRKGARSLDSMAC